MMDFSSANIGTCIKILKFQSKGGKFNCINWTMFEVWSRARAFIIVKARVFKNKNSDYVLIRFVV